MTDGTKQKRVAIVFAILFSGAAFGQTSVMQQSGFLDGQKFSCETYRAVTSVLDVVRRCALVEPDGSMDTVAARWRNHQLVEIACSFDGKMPKDFTPQQCIDKLNSFPRTNKSKAEKSR